MKKPIKVISIHLLTMYGGGGQRARLARGRGGAGWPRAVSDARPRPAHAARCTAGLCTAHALYTRLNSTQLGTTITQSKLALMKCAIRTTAAAPPGRTNCIDAAPPSITRFPALTDRWTITALFTYRRLRINT